MVNRKTKGGRNERRSRDLMRGQGYQVFKSGGSLGLFDLVAVGPNDFALIQVKTRDWPGGHEMEAIRRFQCPSNCKKLLHRWRDGQRQPDIKEVIDS